MVTSFKNKFDAGKADEIASFQSQLDQLVSLVILEEIRSG